MTQTTTRKTYLDFIRIIAIYMVLFNHTGTNGFVLFTVARESLLYPLYLFIAIFIKVAVPLFFMVSGAVLIGKEESFKTILTRRFMRILTVLIVGSMIAYGYTCLRTSPQEMSLKYFLETLYSSRLTTAYWYLYAYLAFLLMLPLLRRLAKAMTDRDYRWMILMFGIIQSMSIIEFLIWKGAKSHNSNFSFFITSSYVFYPLMGYYIDTRLETRRFTRGGVLKLSALSIVVIAVCALMTHYRCTLIDEWKESSCQTFFNTLIFIPTVAVFYGVKFFFLKHDPGEKIDKWISTIGGTTFGIFLIEQILRNETKPVFKALKPYIHTLPASLVWIMAACIAGSLITYFIKKIPFINKYI